MPQNTPAKNTRFHPAYLFFTGLCMGSADVVPGVSGGTMAFILGIYDRLLESIKAFDLQLVKQLLTGKWKDAFAKIPLGFLIPLGLGIVAAIVSLAEVLSYLLHHHESLLFAFFFGLVAASIAALAVRQAWNVVGAIACVLGAVGAYLLVGLVPADPGHSPLILFGSGVVAICAMILPGISGSFILMILGQYKHCIDSISLCIDALRGGDFAQMLSVLFSTIVPTGLGAVIGLAAFARILSWLLRHYHVATVGTLIGFMIGSLRRLWPFKTYLRWGTDRHGEPVPLEWQNRLPSTDEPFFLALILCIAGFVVISLLDHVYDRKNPLVLLMTQGRLTPAKPREA